MKNSMLETLINYLPYLHCYSVTESMLNDQGELATSEKFKLSLHKSSQDKRKYMEAICEYFSELK